MPRRRAVFRCVAGCPGEHPLDMPIYACPRCGELLEVHHDLAALRELPGAAWRALLDERRGRAESGVWAQKEWVHPHLPDDAIVSLGEGRSPLLRAQRLGDELGLRDLRVKQCGTSHTGSFKDLGMTVLVSSVLAMRRAGRPIRAVACASTGDTSAALAAYAAAAGIPSVVILPREKVTVAQLLQPLASGALVLSLDTDFDGCMRIVQELAKDPAVYLANSMNSLRLEGQKTIAAELVQQLGWEVPDWVVVPGGNLGNVSAIGTGFLLLRELGVTDRLPHLACAQAAAAAPLHQAWKAGFELLPRVKAADTQATAIRIGAPVSIRRAVRTLKAHPGSVVTAATEDELADAAARADRAGLFACPQTGVALAGLRQLRAAGTIGPDDRVVVISTAHGLKFAEFKAGYHEGRLPGVTARLANRPVELPESVDAVRAALARLPAK
jgi:threonine synthase